LSNDTVSVEGREGREGTEVGSGGREKGGRGRSVEG